MKIFKASFLKRDGEDFFVDTPRLMMTINGMGGTLAKRMERYSNYCQWIHSVTGLKEMRFTNLFLYQQLFQIRRWDDVVKMYK